MLTVATLQEIIMQTTSNGHRVTTLDLERAHDTNSRIATYTWLRQLCVQLLYTNLLYVAQDWCPVMNMKL